MSQRENKKKIKKREQKKREKRIHFWHFRVNETKYDVKCEIKACASNIKMMFALLLKFIFFELNYIFTIAIQNRAKKKVFTKDLNTKHQSPGLSSRERKKKVFEQKFMIVIILR